MSSSIIDSEFLYWFILSILKPFKKVFNILESDPGINNIWCNAANHFHELYYPDIKRDNSCVIIVSSSSYIKHKDNIKKKISNDYSSQQDVYNHFMSIILMKTYEKWFEFYDMKSSDPR